MVHIIIGQHLRSHAIFNDELYFYGSILRALTFFHLLHLLWKNFKKRVIHQSKPSIPFTLLFSLLSSTIAITLSFTPKCVIFSEFQFLFIRCDIDVSMKTMQITMNKTKEKKKEYIAGWELFIWKVEKRKYVRIGPHAPKENRQHVKRDVPNTSEVKFIFFVEFLFFQTRKSNGKKAVIFH